MRRGIALYACLQLALSAGASALSIAVETRPASAGGLSTLSVTAQGMEGLAYLHLGLSYDWADMLLVEVQPGPLLRSEAGERVAAIYPERLPDQSGDVRLSVVAPAGVAGDQRVVDLVFALDDTLPAFLHITLDSVRAANAAGQALPVTLVNGGIAVITAVTGVDAPLPAASALLPNYPNPFNAGTTVPFVLAATADVHLRIYDLMGQQVRHLHLGPLAAGRYQGGGAARWDGRDDLGRQVASGVYLVEFEAAPCRQVRKVLMLR